MNPQQPRYIEWEPLTQVPGLTFRHFNGEADHQIHLDIANACKQVNSSEWIYTLEGIKNEGKHAVNYDINEQLIFVELNSEPVGYFGWDWREELDGVVVFFPFGDLLPVYWGRGIAALMLQFTEEKCQQTASLMPAHQKKVYRSWRKSAARDIVAFMQKHGFQPERYWFEMTRPTEKELPECPMPAGLEIRAVTPEQYRTIWDAAQEAFRDHWGYGEPAEGMFEASIKEPTFRPQYWKVAWEGDQVCGLVGNTFNEKENEEFKRKRGYTESISVRRPWRGKGLAKALIAESIRMFRDMGMEETSLSVDAENPTGALTLYQHMGYRELPDKTTIILQKEVL